MRFMINLKYSKWDHAIQQLETIEIKLRRLMKLMMHLQPTELTSKMVIQE